MNKRTLILMALSLLCMPAFAVKTEWVSHHSFKEFAEGESKQVEVSDDGFLKLGPAVTEWVKFQAPTLWDAKPDGKGGYYVSIGDEGKIFHVDSGGASKLFCQAKEVNVFALATDAAGNLYYGTSPDGKVYKAGKDGKSEVWFEPAQKYIWALQFDGQGRLFVATGEKGILYRVTTKGQGEVFYDSDEKHLRSLFFDSKSRLWAGSDPEGVVFRFDDLSKKGPEPRVVYDSKQKEVKAFAEDAEGYLYVAVMSDAKSKAAKPAPAEKGPVDALSAVIKAAGDEGASLGDGGGAGGGEKSKKKGRGDEAASEIVRISPSGEPETLGTDASGVYALASAGGDKIWAGTSDSAKFYEANGRREFTLLGQLEAGEVVAFGTAARKEVPSVLAASHPAGLWKVESARAKTGRFESAVVDAQAFARWGRLEGSGNTAGIEWWTRTGNTSKPDKTWSDWAKPEDGKVRSPSGRYLQYKLEMSSEKNLVDEVRVFFRPFNRRPEVTSIQINQPGIEIAKQAKPETPPVLTPSGASNSKPVKSVPELGGGMAGLFGGPANMMVPVRRPGWRSASWQAKDPDSDTLTYDVAYRPTGETEWRELAHGVDEIFHSWDASAWPDGEYILRVTASDAPSNVAGEQKTDDLVSDFFLVDNTGPTLEGKSSGTDLKFTAKDSSSIIRSAEISVDGKDWRPILCDDGILDEKEESFTYSVKDLKAGSHYAILRVKDQADNEASVTVKFKR